MTPSSPAQQAALSAAVAENRAVIEQMNVFVFVHCVDADAAVEPLKCRSQDTNVKLRAMAEQLQKDIRGMRYDENRPHQSGSDQLLLTAKVRVCA